MIVLRRLGQCVMPMLIALDLMACTIWLTLLYPLGLSARPTGRELISGYVGEAAHNGMRWAIRVAASIDWAACRLGEAPGHCDRTWRLWRRIS